MESLVAHLLQGAAVVGEDGDQVAVRGGGRRREVKVFLGYC